MDRNNRRYNRGRGKSWNNDSRNRGEQRQNSQSQQHFAKRPPVRQESREELLAREQAIKDFKSREVICPMCGQPITDLSSALADKNTDKPVHFDCALKEAGKNEKLQDNQRITYIGQGRFAVVTYENFRDLRHFKIERIIEWEDKNKSFDWRSEMAGLFSQVKKI
ncbi:MAG: hypothetical protein K6E51_06895 [Treponema sp.]|nr:hypothetical protein [Treponema sp.]